MSSVQAMRKLAVMATAVALVLVAAPVRAATPAAARMPVPAPTVSGPVAVGLRGFPFNASPVDLSTYGYLEQEYLFSGTARAFDLSPAAIASTGQAATAVTAPYTSRFIVRYPSQPTRFNGTVVVEWLNVTSGYDVDAAASDTWRELVRDGYAYVGVTAQVVGANALHVFDPVRYASIAIPGDQFSYDIFAQAVQAVRSANVRPLGQLVPRRILATGDSQSGDTLNTYINDVYPQVAPNIDGFLVMTSSTALRSNLDVPVMRVMSELEVDGEPAWTNTAHFRQWEIAGGGHTDHETSTYLGPEENREWAMSSGVPWPLAPMDYPGCVLDRMPKGLAIQAALVALDRWVGQGKLPPSAPPIDVANGAIVRDQNDNALGGVRLPQQAVPTGANYGENSNECAPTLGKTVPFTHDQLVALYPTHAAYVERFTAAANAAVKAGWLLRPDADVAIAEAERSPVP
jgi:hypothetical protein